MTSFLELLLRKNKINTKFCLWHKINKKCAFGASLTHFTSFVDIKKLARFTFFASHSQMTQMCTLYIYAYISPIYILENTARQRAIKYMRKLILRLSHCLHPQAIIGNKNYHRCFLPIFVKNFSRKIFLLCYHIKLTFQLFSVSKLISQLRNEFSPEIVNKMGNISTGEFFQKTYQTYGIDECVIGSHDCAYDWKLLGTLQGVCLEYNPNAGSSEKKFTKETQLRITVRVCSIFKKLLFNQKWTKLWCTMAISSDNFRKNIFRHLKKP